MTQINLLPWRAELQEEQKRKFLMLLAASCLMTVALLMCLHLVIGYLINNQEQRNAILMQENNKLESQITEIDNLKQQKKDLIARMQIIENLQVNRAQAVHVFDELVRVVPSGVYVLSAKRESGSQPVDSILIIGRAESNTYISEMMRQIEASQWFTKPVLNEIKVDNDHAPYDANFTLQFQLKELNTNDKKT